MVLRNLVRPPDPKNDLLRFERLVNDGTPFTFIRFSDGEVEILRNRELFIGSGITRFKGRSFSNKFQDLDRKEFDPSQNEEIRKALLKSAIYCGKNFYKGVPSRNNKMKIDQDFLLRLNGGFSDQLTFSDLFLNSNYLRARKLLIKKIIPKFKYVFVVANWRSQLSECLTEAQLIKIPDNFFSKYRVTLDLILKELQDAPKSSLILSSASSLSNIVGHQIYTARPDLTFLDIGTCLNDLLGLPIGIRSYHCLLTSKSLSERIQVWLYKRQAEFKIKW